MSTHNICFPGEIRKTKAQISLLGAALSANCIIAFYVHCSSFGFSIS